MKWWSDNVGVSVGGCKFPCLVYREINYMWCGCFFLEWSSEWVAWCYSYYAKWREQQMCTCVSTYNHGWSREKQIINTERLWCYRQPSHLLHVLCSSNRFLRQKFSETISGSKFLPSLLPLLLTLSRFIIVKKDPSWCFYEGVQLICCVQLGNTQR